MPSYSLICMYVSVRNSYEVRNYAVYSIAGYILQGEKDILGLWLSKSESKHQWMKIFDEIKARRVEDIFFLSIDGVSGLEEGAKTIFPDVNVQICIVHLIRNSLKYVPSKDYKKYTASIKRVYRASTLQAARTAFESEWSHYSRTIDIWIRNWEHVEQLFDYRSAIRKAMCTTNAIEVINAS